MFIRGPPRMSAARSARKLIAREPQRPRSGGVEVHSTVILPHEELSTGPSERCSVVDLPHLVHSVVGVSDILGLPCAIPPSVNSVRGSRRGDDVFAADVQ